jgi:hypothetical protein
VTGVSRQSKTGATWLSGFPGEDDKSSHAATIRPDIGTVFATATITYLHALHLLAVVAGYAG